MGQILLWHGYPYYTCILIFKQNVILASQTFFTKTCPEDAKTHFYPESARIHSNVLPHEYTNHCTQQVSIRFNITVSDDKKGKLDNWMY